MLPFKTTFSSKFELQRKINMPGSSRARSTRGQENEAWAVYKKNPSRESWDDLSGDQYIICPKPPSPAGKILDRRQLFFLANHNSLEQTPRTRPNLPPQDSRDGFFCTLPRPYFLGHTLIWPGYFGKHVLGLFGLLPLSLSNSVGFVSLSEKALLVSISVAILFLRSWHVYFPLSSNFVEKVVLKGSMAAKMASRVSYLVYYYCISIDHSLLCIQSEFEQIITKLR